MGRSLAFLRRQDAAGHALPPPKDGVGKGGGDPSPEEGSLRTPVLSLWLRRGAKPRLSFKGLIGPKGDTGETGVTGVEGPRGFPGTPGRKGEPGEAAYSYRSAFSVGLEARVTVPNVPIRFTKIFYNQQNHYDGSTGKFHCNIPGVYFFSYHITVYMKDVKVSLFKKDKAVLFTYDQYQEKNVDQASGSVLLHLEVGDQVWLQVFADGEQNNGLYADNVNDSTFMGFLLYHDTN
ncbi:adiponectin isoform X2 [Loxodonta africana]|uniref:adiponectin isoform X2 n=1 Tax=Loxodonta africana TaxID=9785 RepID=UPI0030D15146